MSTLKIIFYCSVSLCLCAASSRDEIPDFEFEDEFGSVGRRHRESSFAYDDFDEFFIDDGNKAEYDIATKEKLIQRALFKALAAKDLKYKFSEVIPLLRALNKSQRMVFASIISAQLNDGKSLTLDEVRKRSSSASSIIKHQQRSP